jgi:hypothetical protein
MTTHQPGRRNRHRNQGAECAPPMEVVCVARLFVEHAREVAKPLDVEHGELADYKHVPVGLDPKKRSGLTCKKGVTVSVIITSALGD